MSLSDFYKKMRGLQYSLNFSLHAIRALIAKTLINNPRAPGKFTDKIQEWFVKDGVVRGGKKTYYLVADSIMTGENPFHEEVSVKFRVKTEPPKEKPSLKATPHMVHVESVDITLQPFIKAGEVFRSDTIYIFTFYGGISVEENLENLRQFVIQQEEEVGHEPPHVCETDDCFRSHKTM